VEVEENSISEKLISEEYVVNSDVGHQIKVETEFKYLTKNGSIDGCTIGYILTNTGELELKGSGLYYKNKYITTTERQYLSAEEFDKVRYYIPKIVFDVTTSDGKVITISNGVADLEPGKSSVPMMISTNVSLVGNRHCVSIKPVKIESFY